MDVVNMLIKNRLKTRLLEILNVRLVDLDSDQVVQLNNTLDYYRDEIRKELALDIKIYINQAVPKCTV